MKTKTQQKTEKRARRHVRIRHRVAGTAERPRLAFFRSNTNVYAQVIDDTKGNTIVGMSSMKSAAKGKRAKAEELGGLIAKAAIAKGV